MALICKNTNGTGQKENIVEPKSSCIQRKCWREMQKEVYIEGKKLKMRKNHNSQMASWEAIIFCVN